MAELKSLTLNGVTYDSFAGAEGVSPSATVEQTDTGAVIIIADKDGTTTATVFNGKDGAKGDKGDKGDTGATGPEGPQGPKGDTGGTGAAGTSVTVKSVSESSADGGSNVVTFSDGKTLTVKNGSKGSSGTNGSNGVGVSSVTQTTTSTADGGSNVVTVTLSNGTTSTFTVKNGSKGSTGAAGKDGATAAQVIAALEKETWTFTLEDGSTVTKEVPLV